MELHEKYIADMRRDIIETVGKHGAKKERRLFWEKDISESKRLFAEEYASYRQKHIERVRTGIYAKYGVTNDDIVLVEQLPPVSDEEVSAYLKNLIW